MTRINIGDVNRWEPLDLKNDAAFMLRVNDGRRVSFTLNTNGPLDVWLDLDGTGDAMLFVTRCNGYRAINFSIRHDANVIFLPVGDCVASIRWDNIAPPVSVGDVSESLTVFDPRALGGQNDEHARVVQMMRYNTEKRLHQMEQAFERRLSALQAANTPTAPVPPAEPVTAPETEPTGDE